MLLALSVKGGSGKPQSTSLVVLLYYSFFVLIGVLPHEYYCHWCLFVFSMHFLLQTEVTKNRIEKSDLMLKTVVIQTEELCGKEYVSFNVHQLTHMAKTV